MAQLKDHYQEFISDPERRRIYEREALAFEASELISQLMEEQNITKTELAARVGTSKSHVTNLLSGSRNMTLHTLADLTFVLGYKVEIKASPLDAVGDVHATVKSVRGATPQPMPRSLSALPR